jgi:hypothetical protein
MGPTNEVLRQLVGKMALLGVESLDYWNQTINRRVLNNELKKMDAAEKRALAERLLERVLNNELKKMDAAEKRALAERLLEEAAAAGSG